MKIIRYDEALAYLDSFIDYEKKPGHPAPEFKLERMEHVLSLLGNPHHKFKSIHITGTKGKGSTAAMIASILIRSGFKVGLYTSPHLISFRERIRIGNKPVSEEEVSKLVSEMLPILERANSNLEFGKLSFFEVYTALAFVCFALGKVDYGVIEVGLGGRLDATNVIRPQVSVITPIGLDHVKTLGNTVAAIAREKSGIIKDGGYVVTAPQEREALQVIEQFCDDRNAKLFRVGKDIKFEKIEAGNNGQGMRLTTPFEDYWGLEIPLRGDYQLINAAAAVGAVELLRNYEVALPSQDIKRGLIEVNWPGRLQTLGHKPQIVVDGAQNVTSAAALKEAIKTLFQFNKLILVLGVSMDKDIRGIGSHLCPLAEEVILTRVPNNPRAATPEAIRDRLRGIYDRSILIGDVSKAMEHARSLARAEDLILATGSMYLVGEVMRLYSIEVS